MLKDFLEHKCDIIEISLWAMSWWEQKKTENIIKSNVKCKLYKPRKNISNTISETTDSIKYECILEPIWILIKEWFRLDVSDPNVWNLWKFRVLNLWIPKRNIRWVIDNISVTVEKWQ